MRTFAIGDIHGGLKALTELLIKFELDYNDLLIFMGDYVDGWSESAQVIEFLLEVSQSFNCIFLKGNHDAWAEEWLITGKVDENWYNHGGRETIDSYHEFNDEDKQKHIKFFKRTKMYFVDSRNRLFVHGGFTSIYGAEEEVSLQNLYFDRTLWETALRPRRAARSRCVGVARKLAFPVEDARRVAGSRVARRTRSSAPKPAGRGHHRADGLARREPRRRALRGPRLRLPGRALPVCRRSV